MKLTRPPREQAGFTLVEVMIAVLIVAIVTTTVISSIMFTSRATRLNSNRSAAVNVAQGFIERLQADNFANVGPPPDARNQPPAGGYANIDFNSNPPVYLDEALNVRCRIVFRFTGYGRATAGGSTSLTDATVAGTAAAWRSDEWKGDTLFIVSGRGAGQFAQISGNTATNLTLASALNPAPDATSVYMINNGKTVEVTTTWEYLGKSYSETMESLIVNYRSAVVLGFAGI